jgi:hypothetical protein
LTVLAHHGLDHLALPWPSATRGRAKSGVGRDTRIAVDLGEFALACTRQRMHCLTPFHFLLYLPFDAMDENGRGVSRGADE